MLRVYYRWSGVPCDRNIMYKGCLKTKNDLVRKEIIIIFVCTNKSNGSMDDLFKANVEALARNESGGIMCLQYMGEYDLTQPRVYCKTCTKIYSTVTTFAICYR